MRAGINGTEMKGGKMEVVGKKEGKKKEMVQIERISRWCSG